MTPDSMVSSSVRTSSAWTRTVHTLAAARLGPLYGGGLWGTLAVVAAFLAISIPQYGQPYVIDEAVFPYVADGIVKHGAPFFYNGEFRPNDLGLWHPPLYDYLLAAQVLIFGMSPFAVRAFGAICVIASLLFFVFALRRIAPDLKQYGYVIAAALFLLNPLVISDALVPDIDGTLGLLEVTAALWLSTIVVQRVLSSRWVLILFAFATVVVSTKFEIAAIVALILGCAALVAPAKRWWKFLWVVISFVAGTALSLGLLFAVGFLLKFDARAPFDYLFGSLGSRAPGRSGLEGTLVNLAVGPGSNLVWIGPAIIVAAVIAFVSILAFKPRGVSVSLAGLFLASSLLIIVGYSYITASPFNFPKYTAVVVPGLALVTSLIVTLYRPAHDVPHERSPLTRWISSIAYVLVLVIGTAGIFFISSRYERTQPRALGQLTAITIADFACVIAATGVLAYILTRSSMPRGRSHFKRSVVIGVVAAVVFTPVMVQTSSSLVNATSPFSTRYYYGETGMSKFLSRAAEIVPPGTAMIAPKDVGLQLGRPFYEDARLLPLSPSALRSQLDEIRAPYLVTRDLWDYSEVVFPAQFDVLREYYAPVSGLPETDFKLWKLKQRE
jgi:4-amino-4-deoxy-L-arabinose transferase-like glycosyltransferase